MKRSLFLAALCSAVVTLSASGFSATARKDSELKPWLRLDTGLTHMRRNRDMSHIAYVPQGGTGVRIMNTKTATFTKPQRPTPVGLSFGRPTTSGYFLESCFNKKEK